MHAFGPYRDTEVIDFNDLKGQQLFAISGNTGAGKTTILMGLALRCMEMQVEKIGKTKQC